LAWGHRLTPPPRSASDAGAASRRWPQSAADSGGRARPASTAAAETADLTGFKPVQVEKAREAIEQTAVVPLSRPGLYAAVSSDGVTTYLVDAIEGSCSCKAAANGRRCYHLASALILDASAITRRAA